MLMEHLGDTIHTGVWHGGMVLHMTDHGPACQPERRLARFIVGYYIPL